MTFTSGVTLDIVLPGAVSTILTYKNGRVSASSRAEATMTPAQFIEQLEAVENWMSDIRGLKIAQSNGLTIQLIRTRIDQGNLEFLGNIGPDPANFRLDLTHDGNNIITASRGAFDVTWMEFVHQVNSVRNQFLYLFDFI